MLEDDDYPPYAKDYAIACGRLAAALQRELREERRQRFWREVAIVTACGILAALAIGGLLLAYGVF